MLTRFLTFSHLLSTACNIVLSFARDGELDALVSSKGLHFDINESYLGDKLFLQWPSVSFKNIGCNERICEH